MAAIAGFMRTALHQEPIIVWSCMISTVGKLELYKHALLLKCSLHKNLHTAGLALPLVVPPIRESFAKADVKSPPPVKQVKTLHCLLTFGTLLHLQALACLAVDPSCVRQKATASVIALFISCGHSSVLVNPRQQSLITASTDIWGA